MFEFFNLWAFTLALTMAAAGQATGATQGQVSAAPTQTDAAQGKAAQSTSGNNVQETTPKTTEKKDGEGPDLLQLPETAPANGSPISDTELESYIRNALNRDPALGHAALHVVVTGDRIELSGNVAGSKEKQTAGRLAQSFAGSRKVLNQIAINGGAAVPTPGTHAPESGASRSRKPEDRGLAPSPGPDKATPPQLR